ncbi:MAG: hypothetical protein LBG52_06005 [Candidatus Peribacteria bacterium]|jgi:TRAP-type mannitol/chloroaromatic compound transport system substrate-binding protein|nr:hypothetical protein [Candidatus Peribacteria bacterium]
MARAQHTGTFIWSDYDVNYRQDDASPRSITDGEIRSQKSNTFLIRALSGMSINTPDAIPGVNVNINGAVQMKSEGLLAIEISDAVKGKPDMNNTAFAYSGTYENVDGCVYFADGLYRQLLNISNPSNVKRCGEDSPFSGNIAYENCFLYKGESAEMRFRAGNKIETYKAYASDEAEG